LRPLALCKDDDITLTPLLSVCGEVAEQHRRLVARGCEALKLGELKVDPVLVYRNPLTLIFEPRLTRDKEP
jgi:hypothetical protein